jgi:hypothetical protein
MQSQGVDGARGDRLDAISRVVYVPGMPCQFCFRKRPDPGGSCPGGIFPFRLGGQPVAERCIAAIQRLDECLRVMPGNGDHRQLFPVAPLPVLLWSRPGVHGGKPLRLGDLGRAEIEGVADDDRVCGRFVADHCRITVGLLDNDCIKILAAHGKGPCRYINGYFP